jgi:pyruvate formate lyase activating enzyme
VIGRDWYVLTSWGLNASGACSKCGAAIPGRFEEKPGTWGAKRLLLNMREFV